jgi:hypothetical protein
MRDAVTLFVRKGLKAKSLDTPGRAGIESASLANRRDLREKCRGAGDGKETI